MDNHYNPQEHLRRFSPPGNPGKVRGPILQEPILNSARFEWHEVRKAQHSWLQVDAMTQPIRLIEVKNP